MILNIRRCIAAAALILLSISAVAQNTRIADINIEGNSITRKSIILRELPFKAGDTMKDTLLAREIKDAKQNLVNTSLFNYVTIVRRYADSVSIGISMNNRSDTTVRDCVIDISVEERWYWWPLLDIKLEDRNLSSWLKKMDYDRITYDVGAKIDNIFGRRQSLTADVSIGYERGFNVYYSNIALNKSKTSYLNFYTHLLFTKSVDCITENDKPKHLKSGSFITKSGGIKATYIYRPKIRFKHTVALSFDCASIKDSVLIVNKDYWGMDSHVARKFQLDYSFDMDQRNYIYYPTSGYYIGVNASLSECNDFKFTYWNLMADLQYYKPLGGRWYWGSTAKLSTSMKSHEAYYYDRAIGYENVNMTGYDLYVIDGQHFFTFNNAVKFLILPNKVVKLNFIKKWNKFNKPHFSIYARLQFDTGYVWQKNSSPTNKLPNSFLCGTGVALDILTYYDIALNVGYAVNRDGKGSFFFGFKAPIY